MAAQLDACHEQRGLAGWESELPVWKEGEELATRQACTAIVNAVLDVVPGVVAGGADLTENTGMELKDGATDRHPPSSAAARCTTASASTAWVRS